MGRCLTFRDELNASDIATREAGRVPHGRDHRDGRLRLGAGSKRQGAAGGRKIQVGVPDRELPVRPMPRLCRG